MKNNKLIRYFVFFLLAIVTFETYAMEPTDMQQILREKKVTINVKDSSLEDILKLINKQTKIDYGYQSDLNIDKTRKFSLNVKDVSVESALSTLFKGGEYSYRITDNKILIIKAEPKSLKQEVKKLTIKGRVIDVASSKPVVGATVLITDSNKGAITDIDGKFKLDATIGAQFEVSFVGFVSQIITIENENQLFDIVLKKDAMVVDDVVVTGYGDVKKSSYTGNSIVVKRDELLKASKTNVIKALQSFDPSFRIKENNRWGSDPNALPEVYIRGESGIGVKELDANSLSKSNLKDNPNLPTFIMDGFEISVTKLYDYDPNRIESITILKDAAATALYGSRAANGVVIIKTVTPKAGRVNVSYNFVADMTFPDLSDYNLMNAREKLETERIAKCYELPAGKSDWDGYLKLQNEYNSKLTNILNGVDTYWLSQPLQSIFNHKHSLYVDGGGENLRFGVDLQYTNQDGVMKTSSRDRMGAGFYIQYNYKTLTIKNNTTYLSTKSSESKYGDFSEYTKQLPYDVYKDENGRYLENLRDWDNSNDNRVNPLYEPSLNNFNRSKNEEFVNNLSAKWQIIPSLQFNGQISLTKEIGSSERFVDPLSKRNGEIATVANLVSGELYLGDNNGYSIDMNATLSFNKAFDDHMINILAGVNSKESFSDSKSDFYRGFPSGSLSSLNYAKEMPTKTDYSESKVRLMGVLTSLNYSYRDLYMIDGSVRVDGSSAFGAEKRFAPFWSAGAGINIHKYKFMENVEWIEMLKIRGTYGQTGKANFPAYAARTSYKMFTDDWYKTGYGVTLLALGNPNLKWETTNTLDVGFETTLLDNFIYLKVSHYDKTTIDLITDVTIPSATGFTTYRDNIGEVSNKGYEVDFRISPIRRKNMNLIVNFNLAHNKNRIEKISESLKAYNQSVMDKYTTDDRYDEEIGRPFLQYVEGGSLSSIFAVRSRGINPSDGKEVFIRTNGSLTDTWNVGDQVVVGNEDPTVQGNFGFNFTYKQFNLYTSFMYELGGQRYNSTLVSKVEDADIYDSNLDRRVLTDRWKEVGDIAKYRSIATGKTDSYTTRPSSRFVQDYNMLSLSSVELGYDFSPEITNKMHMSMLRLTLGMTDIFHLSSVKQERGLSYPFARSVNFSVKISF